MRTLYYVNAGASWFGFYLDEGALALANDGARFNSFGAVLAWAGEHDFEFVAKCEPEGSVRVRLRCAGTEVEYERSRDHN